MLQQNASWNARRRLFQPTFLVGADIHSQDLPLTRPKGPTVNSQGRKPLVKELLNNFQALKGRP
ncbi:hypothetical protein C5Y97_19610 [Blastopirellula marina]|uniref:Uncharacterized protein n=1 Tax=Blastopirellula marina TaxID=124 RepID=A0A2S8FHK9_9BACT|nr:hypothetical protein C5Y98_19600 [Blastopirellula marina]PTL42930.1 hypothetical protein C5Y97_19610 [Blastopirellula marina]